MFRGVREGVRERAREQEGRGKSERVRRRGKNDGSKNDGSKNDGGKNDGGKNDGGKNDGGRAREHEQENRGKRAGLKS